VLRAPTFDAVDALKREGLSATDILKAVAELAAHAEIPAAEETLDDMSAWCVQRYFSREQPSP